MSYSPAEDVIPWLTEVPVSESTRKTTAASIGTPDESVTVPVILNCADTVMHDVTRTKRQNRLLIINTLRYYHAFVANYFLPNLGKNGGGKQEESVTQVKIP